MHNFELQTPTTISEAAAALSNAEAQPLGGGQTLIPALKLRLARPKILVSLTGVAEMRRLWTDDDGALCIGGAVTHAEVAAQASAYPALAALAGQIGDPAVRNRGAIGGSLANNDPAACYPAAVLGSGAAIITNLRTIAADDFFQGVFTTALNDGEIITSVRFPIPQAARYEKFLQPASRFALTGAFVSRGAGGQVRVAITGAAENGVYRWREAETALTADFSPGALDGLTVDPDGMGSDLHGSAAYRAHLVKVMSKRAVANAA